jgi:hypothetical protein
MFAMFTTIKEKLMYNVNFKLYIYASNGMLQFEKAMQCAFVPPVNSYIKDKTLLPSLRPPLGSIKVRNMYIKNLNKGNVTVGLAPIGGYHSNRMSELKRLFEEKGWRCIKEKREC